MAIRVESLAERGAVLGAHVGERDRGAFGCESARDRGSDPCGGAGDESDFSFESHGGFLGGAASGGSAPQAGSMTNRI